MKTIRYLLLPALLAGVLHLHAEPGKTQNFTSSDQVPEGLAKSDWQSIRAAYEAGRHAFQPVADGWQARNPGQQWTTKFDGRGFLAGPLDGGWQWGLELRSYGFGEAQQSVGAEGRKAAVQAAGTRLTYQWDAAVREWFVNDGRGLEHGFTVRERPALPAADAEAPLAFTLSTRGTLHPCVSADARGVLFQNAAGATVINYAGLKVWDADGKALAARFESAGADAFRLLVAERGARYPITIDPIAQQAYLKPDAPRFSPAAGDQFGGAVAISGDTVVIGVREDDSTATGVNGEHNGLAAAAGAAYVFIRTAGGWTQQAYLKPANVGTTQVGDQFGFSVAISGDTVVVGAPFEDSSTVGVASAPNENAANSGAVYVFVRSGTAWSQQVYIKPVNIGASHAGDLFGSSVGISGDTVVVGSPGEDSSTTGVGSTANELAVDAGAAYVFARSGTAWLQQAYLKQAFAGTTQVGDNFGASVAVSGNTVVVGAPKGDSSTTGTSSSANESAANSGAAYVFVRNGTAWTQQSFLKPAAVGTTQVGDEFGTSVAVENNTIIVGAPKEDSHNVGINGTPTEFAPDSGAAYVFVRSGTSWAQQAFLKQSAPLTQDDLLGYSVSLSGETAVVSAPLESSGGAAHVFQRSGTLWTEQALLSSSLFSTPAGDQFGLSVAISGDLVIAGAPLEDSSTSQVNGTPDDGAVDAGAAFVFVRSGTAWTQEAFLKPSDVARSHAHAGDQFGSSVAVSGDTVVVGAPSEASSSLGVNSTPDESAADAGAAYVFVRNAGVWSQQAYLKPAAVGVSQAGDEFGVSVAISGDTVVVGAFHEDGSATGVNGAADELAADAGAAYVFVRSGTTWSQQAYLKPAAVGTTQANDQFGGSVAVAGDTVVVGADQENGSATGVNGTPDESAANAGAAYVFLRSGTTWSQQAYLKPATVGTTQALDEFGTSVAIAGDTAVIGATREDGSATGVNGAANEAASSAGAAYVFVRSGTTWTQQAYLKASQVSASDFFGLSVAIAGDTVVVGADFEDSGSTGVNSIADEAAASAGAAYVFVRSGTAWSQQAYLKASQVTSGDRFGFSVAVAGDTVVVGAFNEDGSATGVNGTPDELASGAGAAYIFTRSGTAWTQQAYLKTAAVGTTQAGDSFGSAVAISGDTVIVGAPLEDSSTTGVNGTPNEGATDAGAACVFERSAGVWSQQAYLKPRPGLSTAQASDKFGSSVAVSRDTVVVGAPGEDSSTLGVNSSAPNESAPDSGAAYVFVRTAEGWRQQAYLKPAAVGTRQNSDQFGAAVAVSGDTVIVGAPFEGSETTGVNSTPNDNLPGLQSGAAYVFTRSGTTWTQQAFLKPAAVGTMQGGDEFGTSVAIENNTVIVGAPKEDSDSLGVNITPNESAADSGAAYVFLRSGTTWTQQAYLKPAAAGATQAGDHFGFSVAVSIDTVVVGAPLEASDILGVNSAPNEGSTQAGAAYVFVRGGTTWTQQAFLKPAGVGTTQSFDFFGSSVAVSGDTVVVGAPGEDSDSLGVNSTPGENPFPFGDSGAAYVFTRSGMAWTQQAYLKPAAVGTTQAEDQFGASVAIAGHAVVVGAPGEDSSSTGVNSTPDDLSVFPGAAYVFTRSGTAWTQKAYLKPAAVGATQFFDFFGASVAVSGDMVIVGAPQEDSSSTGVDSAPNEASSDAGAAYIYSTPRLVVEQPAGFSAGSTVSFGTLVAGAGSTALTFTVRNVGLDPLALLSVGVTGGQAGDFPVNTDGMLASVPGGGSTTFTVSFSLAAAGSRTTTLRIVSDDPAEGPLDVTLTGTAVSFTTDTDGDGMNDASEVQLAALGFDWQVSQPALVNTLTANASGAGFFTPTQVQALHMDVPLIQRAPGTGLFTFTFGLQKSTTLTPGSFAPFPFTPAGTSVNGAGKVEFQFTSPDNAAFFRLEPPP